MIPKNISDELKRIKRYSNFGGLVWVLLISLSLFWNLYSIRKQSEDIAKSNARIFFEKEAEFRNWASRHDGLYAPLNERTPSNPNLSHIPNRDIELPSGDSLTLMNPAYMLRQLQDEYNGSSQIISNITSLKPLQSENAPDSWERKALLEFENGKKEVIEFSKINGKEHLRVIRPLIVIEKCLKCHEVHGYKIGDIRGGISVSVPIKSFGVLSSEIRNIAVHVSLILIGFIGIRSISKRFSKNIIVNQKVNTELFEKDERLKLALGTTNAGVWDLNIQTREAFFNERWAEIFGYTLEELAPIDIETWNELVHPDDLPQLDLLLEHHYKNGTEHYEYETRMKHKNGEWIWVQIRGKVITRDEKDKPVRMVGVIVDITNRKNSEKELIESEHKYRVIAEQKKQMTYAYDIESGNIEWSGNLIETIGYTIEEFQNIDIANWEEMIHPDDRKKVSDQLSVAIEDCSDFCVEYHFKRKDNHYFIVEDRGTFLLNSKGKAVKMFGLMKDITEQKTITKRLEESEKKYRSLAENAVDTIWKVDMKLNHLYVSPGIFHTTGYTIAEMMKLNAKDLFPPDKLIEVARLLAKEIELGKEHVGVIFESIYIRKDGKTIPVEISAKVVWDDNGNPIGINGYTRDITERKKTEEIIKSANAQFSSIMNSLDAVVYVADMETYELLFVNNSLKNDIGDVQGSICWQIIQRDKTGPCEFCTNNKLLTENGEPGETYTWEFQNTITSRWYLIKDKAIRWHDGRIVRLEIATDITESKKAENALVESEARFRTTFNQAVDPIFIAEVTEGNIPIVYDINKTVTQQLGYTKSDLIGKPMNLVHIFENEEDILKRVKFLLAGNLAIFETKAKKKNGTLIPIEMSAKRIRINNKYYLYIIERDISERKKWEKEIFKAQQRLEEENANKDKFFSIISHDLKAPFGALLGIAQLLEEDFDEMTDPERKEMIHVARKSANNIYELLEGLLEWSRAKTGRMEFTPSIINLHETSLHVIQVLEQNAKNKNIRILNNLGNNSSAYIDEKMYRTVLRNLIANAIKFTAKGGEINISSKIKKGQIEISVSDNGIGMTSEETNKLFRIEIHHTTLGTENESGTGVGLILCKELVEKNKGKIWVESEFGNGSIFKFTLPVKA